MPTQQRPDGAYCSAIELLQTAPLHKPQAICFGKNELENIIPLIKKIDPFTNTKILIIAGTQSARRHQTFQRLATLLEEASFTVHLAPPIDKEPTVEMVDSSAEIARAIKPGLIIALGGGSAIDCAKATAVLTTNPGSITDYLEGYSPTGPSKIAVPPPPLIAIPTTAGTGAEMTKNAVINIPELSCKRSIRDDNLMPTAALIDPALTLTVPPATTANGGLDTITQLLESCITKKRRPETTRLAHLVLAGLPNTLLRAYRDGNDYPAREHLAAASMISGTCLANAGLAMAHGLAAPLGAMFNIPHGLICGMLLVPTLRYNEHACQKELADALATMLGRREETVEATIATGLEELEALLATVRVPVGLKSLNLDEEAITRIAELATGGSITANPRQLNKEEIARFLRG